MYSDYKDKLQKFYKYQANLFRAFAVYHLPKDTPKPKKIAYELYSAVIFFCLGVYILDLWIAFFAQPTILDKIMKVLFALTTILGSMAKLCSIKKNSLLYQKQIDFLYKDIFTPINSIESAIFQRNFDISNRVRNYYGCVSLLVLNYIFVFKRITHPMEPPLASYTPFKTDSVIVFIAIEFYGYISTLSMCFVNIAYESWCASFLLFSKIQLEILEHRLERIGKHFSSDFAVNKELRKCIQHYTEIFSFLETIEKAISLPASIQVFCSISVLCCNFYAMSITSIEDDISIFLKFFIYQIAMLTQIFLICYFSNEVTLASLRLSYALYSSNWTTWNKRNRNHVKLTLLRFQNPLLVRSINRCYPFDLTAFTSIVNTSYTYFTLLKQMN